MNKRLIGFLLLFLILGLSSSCAPATPVLIPWPTSTVSPTGLPTQAAASSSMPAEIIPITSHTMQPANEPPVPAQLVYDVTSARKRAPYGDSYDLNRLERPFQQDMKYTPELDIVTFGVSEDTDWYYVFIQLNGQDPNAPGIDYGVELDQNADGFGDTLVWAHPPYADGWSTGNVQVYNDSNRDTAGASSAKSDPGAGGNGYDMLVFDGAAGQAADPDLAWVRMQAGTGAIVQFAFKKTLTSPTFLVGVVADAGLKDVTRFDYNDHIKLSEAGSPLRDNQYYPLKLLYAVDNTCWAAYGMQAPLAIAKVCPPSLSTTATPKPRQSQSSPVFPTLAPPTVYP